ncbi:MAG: DUF4390 domain-containing protein [bacterium]|nr:DUF4390 domain-containing protein [bacterium]
MDFLLAIARVMALLSNILIIVSPSASKVYITSPSARLSSDYLTVNAKLENGFPKALDDLILSGTKITLRFKVTLLQGKLKSRELEVIRQVKYNLSKKSFVVFFSETKAGKETQDLEVVHRWMSELRAIEILPSSEIDLEEKYILLIEAALDPIEVVGMREEKFELMILWKNVIPKASQKVSFD